ncbi:MULTISPECIES: hypothetical protein [Wolbachia]|nr:MULTISPECIES: hypothetical protein [Wolbachia]BDG76065.1 hypothetical protein wHmt_06230 [Wolbachia pipientis]BDG77525.1 hypothetical protein wHmc_06570 [Wolbachia pipientis]
MSIDIDKKVQIKAANIAEFAVLDVIGLVNNIRVGDNMDIPKNKKLAIA